MMLKLEGRDKELEDKMSDWIVYDKDTGAHLREDAPKDVKWFYEKRLPELYSMMCPRVEVVD